MDATEEGSNVILVVEDDPDARCFLTAFLHCHGYPTMDCIHAEDARACVGRECPRMAIIDINLPREHGVSLAWELRNRWGSMPIIVASATVFDWDMEDLRDCGADYVIQKPFDMATLEGVVREFYVHGRAADPVREQSRIA